MAHVDSCKTCIYMHVYSTIQSVCRRYPPTALVERQLINDANGNRYEENYVTSRFVEVNDTDWCGEYVYKRSLL